MSTIELHQISKIFAGGSTALTAIDLTISEGERIVVLGPSGSGKTTLLRLIAGLDAPDSGRVLIGGRDMESVAPYHRDVALVFQNQALYPHLNVFGNIAFGLCARGVPSAERRDRVTSIAEMLGLGRLLHRRPAELSGGERQRVALGRAVVRRPAVLLLDEPFSNLDLPLRTALRDELIALHRRFGSTLVHVTHDQSEALGLGERIAVLHQGQLIQQGTPREIHDLPAHRFVAAFVGNPPMNVLPCKVERADSKLLIRLIVSGPEVVWNLPGDWFGRSESPVSESGRVDMGLRPEAIRVCDQTRTGELPVGLVRAEVRVDRLEFQGSVTHARLDLGGISLVSRVPPDQMIREGVSCDVILDLQRASWFIPETGLRWASLPRRVS